MKKTIKIKDKEYTVREVTFKESVADETRSKIEAEGYTKVMLQLSTGITDEEFDKLSRKDGMALWKVYMDVNEEDFLSPQPEEKDSKQV